MILKNPEKKDTIGVSCVGSGIGQSVINSLRLSRLPIKTIGFGTNPFGYGAYDCDLYDYTPNIYAPDYIERLIEKCQEYQIDLLIPGLDDETLFIARNIDKFNSAGIKTICSRESLIAVCRDKQRLGTEFTSIADVFVKNFDRETLEDGLSSGKIHFPLIAKPRSGFASREISVINSSEDLANVSKDHLIQELLLPRRDYPNYDNYMQALADNRNLQISEISIQLVYAPEGELMGRMASYNKLLNGVPIEILPFESEEVWSVIDRLTPALLKLGLRGPLNIQGRLTEQGLKLFEMNPRFTGITGLRALMGFNEVEACVKEWLGIDRGRNKLILNFNRFGMRQTADKVVPVERNMKVAALFKGINGALVKKKKTLFITGSCGYLGQNLIDKLLELNSDTFEIWAFDRDKNRMQQQFGDRLQFCFDRGDLLNGRVPLGNIDILLHCGFARPHYGNVQIADSLAFTMELFTRAAAHQVPAIINISSQSVYGLETEPPWTENTPVAPAQVYAQAKYASELFLKSLKTINNQLSFSSLRLAALAGGAPGLAEVDFLPKIVRQAYEGKSIHVVNGSQQMERLDLRDAQSALLAMLCSDPTIWRPVYNIGSGKVYQLLEIVRKVVEISSRHNGGILSDVVI